MMIMKPPFGGQPASAILGKSVPTNANGFARIYSDADAAKLKAAGWTVAAIAVEDDFPALAKSSGMSLPHKFKMKHPDGKPLATGIIGRVPEYSKPDGYAIVNQDEALRLAQAGWEFVGTIDGTEKVVRALNGEALHKGIPASIAGRVVMAIAKIGADLPGARREGETLKAEFERYAGDVKAHELIKAAHRAPRTMGGSL
jgi:hypothetical protein